jgi:hypothetical protein
MAGQDPKLADVISVLNNALQVALLQVERDPAIQHAGADAAQIRDAVFNAATAAHDLWLMTQTDGGQYSAVGATVRDAEVPSCGDTARKVRAGAAVGAALGGILKGAKGALTGAAIGAGGATVYQLATHGKGSTSRLLNTSIELARAILRRFGSITTGEESSRLSTWAG